MKPKDGYIAYIVNPKSGAGSQKLVARQFEQYLADGGFDVRVTLTASLEDACELATDAAVDYDCAAVVAAGGDGTVREVAHGLEGSDKPLLLVPSGTENLLANELGFDDRLRTIIGAFEGNCIRSLDLGSINGKCFTSIAGFGFDAEVVERVSRSRRGHISHLDYFWPIWNTFWSYRFDSVAVEVDGEEIYDGRGLVFVGNISRYAVGLDIMRYADYSDGLLDVCIYRCKSKLRLLKHSAMTVLKQHVGARDVTYVKGRHIRVSSSAERMRSEIDGDPGPALPVEIKVIPQAVNVLVPGGARPAGLRTRLLRAIG